jgi:two-component system, cell cycle sensor histidine kinase and response regulator CckA
MTHGRPKSVRVLYVDDSPFDRALVRDALERESEGFEMTEAATRAEFEAILATGATFDLVLSDFNIMGMTGLDVLEVIQARRPGVPVVLVTGTGSEEIAVRALKHGASDYVIKQPHHIRRLPATIHQTLDSVRARHERDRARERLEQVQCLEAVGRLAGGIAHDFNNLLTVIRSSAEIIAEELGPDHPLRTEADEIEAAAVRATELTRHLLLFSSGDVAPRSDVDAVGLVRETLGLLEKAIPPGISLVVELPATLPPLRTNPARFQQVLLNLGLNARDAIGHKGTIRILVDACEGTACRAMVNDWEGPTGPEPILRIRVRDDGHGMTPEVRARAFEPFFTTKALGEGSGLGLATAFGTVRQAGGTILVESAPGQGTLFTVLIPFDFQPGVGTEPTSRPDAAPSSFPFRPDSL